MIKKIFLTIAFLLSCVNCWANVYYVRCDGGTPAQCDGTHDAPQSGAVDGADPGTVPDCAWNSPNYPIGGNQNTGGAASLIAASDTIIIDGEKKAGCSPTTSGRAEYEVGLSAPNMSSNGNCNSSQPYACANNIVVSGATSATKTKVYGKGWDVGCPRPPQIWGNSGAPRVLQIGSNTDIRCLEITDHSGCMFRHAGGGNIANSASQDPIKCSEPYQQGSTVNPGKYARTGLVLTTGAHDINLADIWIHGLAYKSVAGDSLTGNIDLTRFHMRASSDSGFSGSDGADDSGNYTLTSGSFDYIGCGEKYPADHVFSNLRSNSDIHDCWSQAQGGYGDAIAKSAKQGNWTFEGLDCFGSVSDCIDHLYDSINHLKIRHSSFEQNAGAAIKSGEPLVDIENNMILGNCAGWQNNAAVFGDQSAPGRSGTSCNNNGVCDANENFQHCTDCVTFNYCRPQDHATLDLVPDNSAIHKITGNTISGTGDVLIREVNNGACNGTAATTIKNNVILGATDLNNGDTADYFYSQCGSGSPVTPVEDYNYICATKTYTTDCTGTHSHCYAACSSLNLVGPLQDFSPTYYNGTNYAAAHFLTASSPAHGASSADETVSLTGTSDDYTSFKRRLTWDAGGWEYRPSFTVSTDQYQVSQ